MKRSLIVFACMSFCVVFPAAHPSVYDRDRALLMQRQIMLENMYQVCYVWANAVNNAPRFEFYNQPIIQPAHEQGRRRQQLFRQQQIAQYGLNNQKKQKQYYHNNNNRVDRQKHVQVNRCMQQPKQRNYKK